MKKQSLFKLVLIFVLIALICLLFGIYHKSVFDQEQVLSTKILDKIKDNQGVDHYQNTGFYGFLEHYKFLSLTEANKGLTAQEIKKNKTYYYLISKANFLLTEAQQYMIAKYCFYNLHQIFLDWPHENLSEAIDICRATRSKFPNDFHLNEEDRALFFAYDFYTIIFIYVCFIFFITRSFKNLFLFLPFVILGNYALIFRWGVILSCLIYSFCLILMMLFTRLILKKKSILIRKKQLQPIAISKALIFSTIIVSSISLGPIIVLGCYGLLSSFFDYLIIFKLFPLISLIVLVMMHMLMFYGIYEDEKTIVIKKISSQILLNKYEIKGMEVRGGSLKSSIIMEKKMI